MTNDKLERVARALGDEALKPILREMYARTAEAWLNAPKWAGEPYRNGEHDAILFERGLPVLRAHIDEAAIAACEAEADEREPTEAMIEDGAYILRMSTPLVQEGSTKTLVRRIYIAMRRAAPPAEPAGERERELREALVEARKSVAADIEEAECGDDGRYASFLPIFVGRLAKIDAALNTTAGEGEVG